MVPLGVGMGSSLTADLNTSRFKARDAPEWRVAVE